MILSLIFLLKTGAGPIGKEVAGVSCVQLTSAGCFVR
jgi:hypothetical protein